MSATRQQLILQEKPQKTYSTLPSTINTNMTTTHKQSLTKAMSSSSSSKAWDNRTRFVVYGQVFLFLVAWSVALSRLIAGRFWDAKHNEENLEAVIANEDSPKALVHLIKEFFLSYYTTRFVVFCPHVVVCFQISNIEIMPFLHCEAFLRQHKYLFRRPPQQHPRTAVWLAEV